MARIILMTQNQELEKPAAQPPGAEPNNTEKPKAGMIFVEQSFAWREEAFMPTASDEGGAPSSNRQSLQDKVKNYSACPEKTMNAKFLKEALKYLLPREFIEKQNRD